MRWFFLLLAVLQSARLADGSAPDAQPCASQDNYLNYGLLSLLESTCTICPGGFAGEYEPSLGSRVCRPCGNGSGAIVFTGTGDTPLAFCTPCKPGQYNEAYGSDGWRDHCRDCPAGRFSSGTGLSACESCPPGKFASEFGQTDCVSCAEWPEQPVYASQSGSVRCEACPEGALCEPNSEGLYNDYVNQDGYYLLPGAPEGQNLFSCLPAEACRSHGRCHQEPETGDVTMEGPFCGACREGFGKPIFASHVCRRCPSLWVSAFGLFLSDGLLIGLASLVTIMVYMTDYTKPRNVHSVITKQVLNYVQMSAIVLESTGFSTHLLKPLLDLQGFLMAASGMAPLSYGETASICLAWHLFPGSPIHAVIAISSILWIPFWATCVIVAYKIWECIAARLQMSPPEEGNLLLILNIFLYVAQVRSAAVCLTPWTCEDFGSDHSFLHLDTRVKCDSPDLIPWKVVSMAGFVAISFGIPLIVLLQLQQAKEGRKDLWEPETLQSLGFFYTGFERRAWYFECVLMLRKAIFQLVVLAPTGMGAGSSAYLTIVTGVFMVLHLVVKPYDKRSYFVFDRVETASLMAVIATSFLAVLKWIGDRSYLRTQKAKDLHLHVLQVVILGFHIQFFAVALWGLLRRSVQEFFLNTCKIRFQNPEKRHPLYLVWRRFIGMLFKYGTVRVGHDGLLPQDLSYDAKLLFGTLFAELTGLYAASGRPMTYAALRRSIEKICVEALYSAEQRKKNADMPVKQTLRYLSRLAEKLPVGRVRGRAVQFVSCLRAGHRRVERMITLNSERLLRVVRSSSKENSFQSTLSEVSATSDCQRVYDDANISRTQNQSFTVEDLHMALLSLGDTVMEEPKEGQALPSELAAAMEERVVSLRELCQEQEHLLHKIHRGETGSDPQALMQAVTSLKTRADTVISTDTSSFLSPVFGEVSFVSSMHSRSNSKVQMPNTPSGSSWMPPVSEHLVISDPEELEQQLDLIIEKAEQQAKVALNLSSLGAAAGAAGSSSSASDDGAIHLRPRAAGLLYKVLNRPAELESLLEEHVANHTAAGGKAALRIGVEMARVSTWLAFPLIEVLSSVQDAIHKKDEELEHERQRLQEVKAKLGDAAPPEGGGHAELHDLKDIAVQHLQHDLHIVDQHHRAMRLKLKVIMEQCERTERLAQERQRCAEIEERRLRWLKQEIENKEAWLKTHAPSIYQKLNRQQHLPEAEEQRAAVQHLLRDSCEMHRFTQ